MTIVEIQPRELPNKTLPYPYFIDKKGMVGRQDFWKGHPEKLLGFSRLPVSGKINLNFQDFWLEPEKAISMYPVFADKNDNWFTKKNPIESVEIEKK